MATNVQDQRHPGRPGWVPRALAAGAALLLGVTIVAPASAAAPVFRESDSYTDRFFDNFIWDICGIETWTTLTERWTFTEHADGSAVFHNVRTFVPDDPRIPIERGAATSFNAADGSRVVIGSPTRLTYRTGGGTLVLDAGRGTIDPDGNLVDTRGRASSWTVDLVEVYCPQADAG